MILSKPALYPFFDLSGSGAVGDTIGGITAPIINLLGAILVYASFRQQLEANRIQKNALHEQIKNSQSLKNFDTILDIFHDCVVEYKGLKFGAELPDKDQKHWKRYQEESGLRGLKLYIYALHTQEPLAFNEYTGGFRSIINVLNLLTEKLRRAEMEKEDKELVANLIVNFYESYLQPVNSLIKSVAAHISGIEAEIRKNEEKKLNLSNHGRKNQISRMRLMHEGLTRFENNLKYLNGVVSSSNK